MSLVIGIMQVRNISSLFMCFVHEVSPLAFENIQKIGRQHNAKPLEQNQVKLLFLAFFSCAGELLKKQKTTTTFRITNEAQKCNATTQTL